MRAIKTILLVGIWITTCFSYCQAQPVAGDEPVTGDAVGEQRRKMNFFIISKPKKGKLDMASRFNIFRGKIKGLFRRKKFVAVVARNAVHATAKVERKLKKYNGRIGTIWFDSHGMYKKGYSLFLIGRDEISYHTLKDTGFAKPLARLSLYTDPQTKVVIGSCYGGATYYRYSIDYRDTTRMNGDSLMIALGHLLKAAAVYGSESWVMTKPGLFLKRAAVAGYPRRKLFRDTVYEPAWRSVGKWNEYNTHTKSFALINPVTMDMYGNLLIRSMSYTDKADVIKDVNKKIGKLKPGLFK